MKSDNARAGFSILPPLLAGVLLVCVALMQPSLSRADRLKDLADIEGVRSNPLVGYGLVVGLNGTGDQTTQTPFTVQSFKSMLQSFGIAVPADMTLQLKNVAAVALHADLPAFSRPGQSIDITASSIGNAKSLRGGTLLLSPLRGADGQIYAVAQGNLVVGGFGAEGIDGSKLIVNQPSVGRIPGGAMVERAVASPFNNAADVRFNLRHADFTTSRNVVDAINHVLGPDVAKAQDAGSVIVHLPSESTQRVVFMSVLENLDIKPGVNPARVVINSRTGTIVIGENVRVLPAAVTHGNLTVTISESQQVSQPLPFSKGETAVVPKSDIKAEQQDKRMFMFGPGVSLNEIVQAVNRVGVAPGDLMAILEALRQAGALQAELVVI